MPWNEKEHQFIGEAYLAFIKDNGVGNIHGCLDDGGKGGFNTLEEAIKYCLEWIEKRKTINEIVIKHFMNIPIYGRDDNDDDKEPETSEIVWTWPKTKKETRKSKMANEWSCFFCKHCQLNNFTVDTKRKVDEDGTEHLMCRNFWCDHAKSFNLSVAIEPTCKYDNVQSVKSALSERGCGDFEERQDEKPHYEQLDLFEMQHHDEKEKEEA